MYKKFTKQVLYTTLNFAFLFLITFILLGCSEKETEEKEVIRPVKAFQIPSITEFVRHSLPGRAKATQEVDLAFRVAGPLIEFPVKVGDEVDEGELVARIDPRDFEVNLNLAKGKLDNARAASVRAASEYQRELNILKQDPGATSQTAVDRKREERDRAQANIRSFAAEVEAAEDRLSYTFLRAPFDGNVVRTYVENFESVQIKQPILRILDDSSIEMVVNVPENSISLVPYVENISAIFDAFPDVEIPAKVKEIGREASITTRTYPVTLIMEQPENVKILPGMAGKVFGKPPRNIDQELIEIEIPVSAVFTDEASDNTFVWLINEKSLTVKKQKVEVGRLSDRGIRILSGLNRGEWVATAGVNYLFEGQKVRLLESSME